MMCYGCDLVNEDKTELQSVDPVLKKKKTPLENWQMNACLNILN